MDKLNAELKQHNAMDLLEEDLSREFIAKMKYFKHFEEDGTLDWFFHPDLCRIEALDDYHRLVLRNHVRVYIVSVFNYAMIVSTIRCCLIIWFCDHFSLFLVINDENLFLGYPCGLILQKVEVCLFIYKNPDFRPVYNV